MENTPIPEGIETWRDGDAVMFRWKMPEASRYLVWSLISLGFYFAESFLRHFWQTHPFSRDAIAWMSVGIPVIAYVYAATRVDRITVVISPDGVRSTVGPLPFFHDSGVRAGEIHGVVTRSRALSKGKYLYWLMYIDRSNRERRLLSWIGKREHAETVAKSISIVLGIPERKGGERRVPAGMKVRRRGDITTMIPSRRTQLLTAMPLLAIAVVPVFVFGNTAAALIPGAVFMLMAAWLLLATQEISISPGGVKRVNMPVSFGRNVEIAAPDIHSLSIAEEKGFFPGMVFEVTCFDRGNEKRILAACGSRDEADYIEESIREIAEPSVEV